MGYMLKSVLLLLAVCSIGFGFVVGCEGKPSCPCDKWRHYLGKEVSRIRAGDFVTDRLLTDNDLGIIQITKINCEMLTVNQSHDAFFLDEYVATSRDTELPCSGIDYVVTNDAARVEKIKANQEARRQAKAEAGAKRQAEADAKRQADLEAMKKEQDAIRKAREEAEAKAEAKRKEGCGEAEAAYAEAKKAYEAADEEEEQFYKSHGEKRGGGIYGYLKVNSRPALKFNDRPALKIQAEKMEAAVQRAEMARDLAKAQLDECYEALYQALKLIEDNTQPEE